MNDIYKLDYLDGMTVGAGQDFDNFAEVIDYLLDNYPYKESEAREICMNSLEGEDIDENDPDAEWGDQMYARAAGK